MRRRSPPRALLCSIPLLLISACRGSGGTEPPASVEADRPIRAERLVESIEAEAVLAHIAYLASDELMGRDTPSPGLELAARYVADAFASYGLEPAGDQGSYMQRYPYVAREQKWERSELHALGAGHETSYRYRTDFFVIPSPDSSAEGELVYAGDLGSVVDGFPEGVAGTMAVVTAPPHVSSELIAAVLAASRAGVAGLVIVLHPETPDAVIGLVADQIEGGAGMLPERPAIGLTHAAAAALFRDAGHDLEGLRGGRTDERQAPVAIGDLALRLETPVMIAPSEPANVAALLRGGDPQLRDTYVLVTAHYDHEGVGAPDASGDSVYNGADDNASGTAVLLEVARVLAGLPQPPARSVVFLAVSGEEKNLVGSKHYAEYPTVPGSAIVANINIDMVGRGARDTLIASGQEYTSLGPLALSLAQSHPVLGLTLAPEPDPTEFFFLRSDQVSFVRGNIPAIFFTTPDHEDYHRPSDEVEGIDADKVARVATLTALLTVAVAQNAASPTWNPGALEEIGNLLSHYEN